MANARLLIRVAAVAVAVNASAVAAQSHVHPGTAGGKTADSIRMAEMADHAMSAAMSGGMSGAMDMNMTKHMALTPSRPATHADSARARAVAADLKRAIAKYEDTSVAVADGYRMFLPNVKTQHVFHFTNYRRAFKEAFRFDPAQPTSLLYKRAPDGTFHLVGAMYTMPKRAKLERLNERVPLSIAHWHRHVNWCVPKPGDQARYTERDSAGLPKFGPDSPIATKAACDVVDGRFVDSLFGWMLHVNVFEGDDLGTIFGDEHHSP